MVEQDDDALIPVSMAKVLEIATAIAEGGSRDAFVAACAEQGFRVMVSARTKAFTLQHIKARAADGDLALQSVQTGDCEE